MKVWIRNLVVLLLAQLVLLGFLQFTNKPQESEAATLFELERGAVTGMTVNDADGNEVSLARNNDEWLLGSGLPANSSKVTDLLDKLAALSLSWPVATSAATHERFEVADDNYQRRLTLNEGAATLWFGTSPGYQQIHARSATDDVYAVKLATYEMPATGDDWLDKSLLHASGSVTGISWSTGMTLKKTGEDWLLGAEAGRQTANAVAAQAVVQRLAELEVLGVLAAAPSAAPSDAKEILLSDSDGEYRLSYWPRESNNDHVVMSTRYPGEAFRMSNYVAEQLAPAAAELRVPDVVDDGQPTGVPEVNLNDLLPTPAQS